MTLPDQVTSLSLSKKLKELGVPQKSCKEKHLNGQICECFQKEQPKCKYCWDKGFYSVWKGIHGSTDFPGDPNYGKNPYWNNIPCPRCNPEQPEQKVHNRLVNMAIGHVRDTAQPSALITQPQELRQEECDCNDIEYCSACIDSPKAPVGWKNCLNKRFRFKRSLDDRHIYYLADDDDDETQYGYLDQFIEVLMMQAEQKAREEEREKANKIFDWLLGIEGDFPSRKEGDPPYYWRKILREKLKSLTQNHIMNKETAKKWLKDWKQDIDNLSIEVRGENVVPLVSVKMVVKHLLEAQKIIERERAVKIAQEIVRSNRFDSDIIDTLNELKQEILQSTKE